MTTIADDSSRISTYIACSLADQIAVGMGERIRVIKISPQRAGSLFTQAVMSFTQKSLSALSHLRPAGFSVEGRKRISSFAQYKHLDSINKSPELRKIVGPYYIVELDIAVGLRPHTEKLINSRGVLIDSGEKTRSIATGKDPILHGNISCKLTLRNDRAQNARTEALGLLRLRRGRAPHIMVVTAEPLPGRIMSLAGCAEDIDCIYHIALAELEEVVKNLNGASRAREDMDALLEAGRLRDIRDLPFDLIT